MDNQRIFKMAFASVYPHYLNKVERKGRTKEEVDTVIRWLTGYSQQQLEQIIENKTNFEDFFAQAPQLHPNAPKITGVICGYRIEDIENPLMQKIRYMDKLVAPEKVKDDTNGFIGNWNGQSEVIFSFQADSQKEVEEWRDKVKLAGAEIISEPQDYQEGYTFSFADPDGHKFNILYWPGM